MSGISHIRELCAKLLEEDDAEKAEVICAALRAALDERATSINPMPQASETV